MRHVFLDPDGTAPECLHVVIRASTGVRYQQQYGGTACMQGEVEGYLVPVWHGPSLAALRHFFERTLRGTGTGGFRWPPEHVALVREAVAGIPFWTDDEPGFLALDEDLLSEADEAWLPVRTPDGPGILLWANSD